MQLSLLTKPDASTAEVEGSLEVSGMCEVRAMPFLGACYAAINDPSHWLHRDRCILTPHDTIQLPSTLLTQRATCKQSMAIHWHEALVSLVVQTLR